MIDLSEKSVLLVDDDEQIHADLGRFFRELGYEVIHCFTMQQAVDAFVRFRGIGLCLVDVHLRGSADYDGLHFLKIIRTFPPAEKMLKFLMGSDINLSDGSDDNFERYEHEEGVKLDGLIEKPVSEKALRVALQLVD